MVREKKILQGQGNVREFYSVLGKIGILKKSRENWNYKLDWFHVAFPHGVAKFVGKLGTTPITLWITQSNCELRNIVPNFSANEHHTEQWYENNCNTIKKVRRNISGQMGAKDCCNRRLEAATIQYLKFCIHLVREI